MSTAVPTIAAALTPDTEATTETRVHADLTRATPTTEPATKDLPETRASGQPLDGICYRTPELQDIILEKLRVELCQVVNEKELYRIRNLGSVSMPSVKAGDFAGLVNIQSMTLRTGEIEERRPKGPRRPQRNALGHTAGAGTQNRSHSQGSKAWKN